MGRRIWGNLEPHESESLFPKQITQHSDFTAQIKSPNTSRRKEINGAQ